MADKDERESNERASEIATKIPGPVKHTPIRRGASAESIRDSPNYSTSYARGEARSERFTSRTTELRDSKVTRSKSNLTAEEMLGVKCAEIDMLREQLTDMTDRFREMMKASTGTIPQTDVGREETQLTDDDGNQSTVGKVEIDRTMRVSQNPVGKVEIDRTMRVSRNPVGKVGSYSTMRVGNRTMDDNLSTALEAICDRLEAIETRCKKESDSNARRDGDLEYRDFNKTTRDDDNFRESRGSFVTVGNNVIVKAKLPKGGWLKNPFEELKFFGRNDAQNPIKFLRKFDNVVRYEEVEERDQLYYFGKCMRGAAASWYDVRDPEDIESAKEAFRDYFWGEEYQARFREEVYNGKYKFDSATSMSEYALNISKQAKYLSPPMADNEIIRCVKRHFGESIAREIRPTTVKTVEELVKLLDELDYERKRAQALKTRTETPKSKPEYPNKDRANPKRFAKTGESSAKPYTANNAKRENTEQASSTGKSVEAKENVGKSSRQEIAKVDRNSYDKRVNKSASIKNDLAQRKIATIDEVVDISETEEEDAEPEKQIAIMRTKDIIREVDELSTEDQNKTTARAMPFATVTVGKIKIQTLIDTGAQISAITKTLFDKLNQNKVQMQIVPIRKFSLVGAFSDRGQPIANRVQLTFRLRKKEFTYELYVVKNLSYEMILGHDFLSENTATLRCDVTRFRVDFPNESEPPVRLNVIDVDTAERKLKIVLNKHAELFDDTIGRVNHYRHKITMITDKPYKAKVYPVPEVHRNRVREHLAELVKQDIIEKSTTQYVNPVVIVAKKSGDIRLCLDARELNKRMTNDHEQPPTIEEVFRRIGNKSYFTTLDVASAFWQIPLTEDSKPYTGFMFDNRSYVFKRLPFGLKTAGASFTRAMRSALGEECDAFIIVYLDDILIASNTIEEHLYHVNYVLEKLRRVGFRLNREKCEFLKTEITFLGHTFDSVKAEMNKSTKDAIRNFAKPKNKKAIQAFLGLVNWDRRFVRNLSRLTKPLENLLKKAAKFQWTEETQDAFEAIKRAFEEAPSLFVIRPGMKFGIYVDASKYGLGAMLYQYNDDDTETRYTVAYASRSLKGAELNYTVTEIECLALVWALRKWHTTLLGRHVRVHSDHRALKFLTSCVDDSSRIARWIAFLNEFNLEIIHVPGKQNVIADTLSRNNVKNGYAKKQEKTKRIAVIVKPNDETETADWCDTIAEAQRADENLLRQTRERPNDFVQRDGLIRRNLPTGDRVVLPESVKWKIIDRVHNYILHFGTDKVADFADRYMYIPNLERLVRDVVASCSECQATKYYTRPTRGTEYYVLPEKPGKVISLDLFGPLPQTPRGNKYILVLMDQFSKLTKLFPMKNQKLETIMDILQMRYFPTVGIPNEILTDNGGQFITDRWREFGIEMGFSTRKTSPYNPQSNPVERVMRELGRIIRLYAHDRQTLWDKIVQRAEVTINATVHRSTGYRPVDLHPGYDNQLPIDRRLIPQRHVDNEDTDGAEEEEDDLERRINKAAEILQKRAAQRKIQTDKHGEAKPYQQGDKVWVKLHRRSDASRRLTKKIHMVFDGPYTVRREARPNAYVLEDEEGNSIGTFNSRQLKPHREAKLKPAMQINMLRTSKPVATINRKKVDRFIVDLEEEPELSTDEELTGREPIGNSTPSSKIPDSANNDEGIPEESQPANQGDLKRRRKRSKITEKGMRHISRITNLIYGNKQIPFTMGRVQGQTMKILMDTRGEFDVITKKAIQLIEDNQEILQKIDEPKNIPAYLKRERNIKIRAVNVTMEAYGRELQVEAMILDGKEPCIMIGRNTRRQLGKVLREENCQAIEAQFALTRWSEHIRLPISEEMNEGGNWRSPNEPEGSQHRSEEEEQPRKRQKVRESAFRVRESRAISSRSEIEISDDKSEAKCELDHKNGDKTCKSDQTCVINGEITDNIKDTKCDSNKPIKCVDITKLCKKGTKLCKIGPKSFKDRNSLEINKIIEITDKKSQKSNDNIPKVISQPVNIPSIKVKVEEVDKTFTDGQHLSSDTDILSSDDDCCESGVMTLLNSQRLSKLTEIPVSIEETANFKSLSKVETENSKELKNSAQNLYITYTNRENTNNATLDKLKQNIGDRAPDSTINLANNDNFKKKLSNNDKFNIRLDNNLVLRDKSQKIANSDNFSKVNKTRNIAEQTRDSLVKTSHKVENQDGRSAVFSEEEIQQVSRSIITQVKRNTSEMQHENAIKDFYKEEDMEYERVLQAVRLRGVKRRREMRIKMLKSFADTEDEYKKYTSQQLDQIIESEREKTNRVHSMVISAMKAQGVSNTYYDKTTIPDVDGQDLFEVRSIIEVKFLKDQYEAARPFKAEFIIQEGNLKKRMTLLKGDAASTSAIRSIEESTSSRPTATQVSAEVEGNLLKETEEEIQVIELDKKPSVDNQQIVHTTVDKLPTEQKSSSLKLKEEKIPRVQTKPKIIRQVKIEATDARQIIQGKRILLKSLLQADKENQGGYTTPATPKTAQKAVCRFPKSRQTPLGGVMQPIIPLQRLPTTTGMADQNKQQKRSTTSLASVNETEEPMTNPKSGPGSGSDREVKLGSRTDQKVGDETSHVPEKRDQAEGDDDKPDTDESALHEPASQQQ